MNFNNLPFNNFTEGINVSPVLFFNCGVPFLSAITG